MTVEDLCRQLTPHQPADDVTYKAGVDVDGNDVVPADLDDRPSIDIPETTLLTITVDQASQLGLVGSVPYRPEAYIGEVLVDKTGNVYFNNKRISEPQLQVLCQDKR